MSGKSHQRIGEDLGHVLDADGGEMLDLVAATGAGEDDGGAVGLVFQLFDERFGDFQGEFVFRGHHAEGTGHAAAAGVEHLHSAVRQPCGETQGVFGVGQGLGVAMRMDGEMPVFMIELQSPGFLAQQTFNEILEQEAARGNFGGAGQV